MQEKLEKYISKFSSPMTRTKAELLQLKKIWIPYLRYIMSTFKTDIIFIPICNFLLTKFLREGIWVWKKYLIEVTWL